MASSFSFSAPNRIMTLYTSVRTTPTMIPCTTLRDVRVNIPMSCLTVTCLHVLSAMTPRTLVASILKSLSSVCQVSVLLRLLLRHPHVQYAISIVYLLDCLLRKCTLICVYILYLFPYTVRYIFFSLPSLLLSDMPTKVFFFRLFPFVT